MEDLGRNVQLVIAGIALLMVVRGAWRGLSGELSPIIGLIAGLAFAWFSYPPLASIFKRTTAVPAESIVFYSAFACFVASMILFLCVTLLVKRVLAIVIAQPFNAIFGGLIAAAKVALLVSLIGGVCGVAPAKLNELKEGSRDTPVMHILGKMWVTHFERSK